MKRIYEVLEPARVITTWLIIMLSILFVIGAIVMFPIVLSKLTECNWWLLGYLGYVFILWLLYEIFID